MERLTLSNEKIAPTARDAIAQFHRPTVELVATTVAQDRVVIVGMAQNPFVRRARKLLDDAGVRFTYLEYGSYLSQWRERLAIKLWAGFPTFPMVFVDGTLIGGHAELVALQSAGQLPR
jgi:glutaredoxin-related protein